MMTATSSDPATETTAPTSTAPLSPQLKEAAQAVKDADLSAVMESEYEPLNVHIYRDKENGTLNNNGPLSTRDTYGLMSPSNHNNRWVDRMVKMANACNSLVISKCNLCHVYANRQVEFEQERDAARRALETPATSVFSSPASPTERVWQKMNAGCNVGNINPLEVNLYRQFLFDEESVVDMLEEALDKMDNPGDEEAAQQQQSTHVPELHFV